MEESRATSKQHCIVDLGVVDEHVRVRGRPHGRVALADELPPRFAPTVGRSALEYAELRRPVVAWYERDNCTVRTHELVAVARAGDTAAFAVLVERNRAQLEAVVGRMVRAEDAEETATRSAFRVTGGTTPRPMTSDLMAEVVRVTGARVERVVVTSMREKTFYAVIALAVDGRVEQLDARPSDALNLAVRLGAPIFVEEGVLEAGGTLAGDVAARMEAEADKADAELPPGEWRRSLGVHRMSLCDLCDTNEPLVQAKSARPSGS